MWYVERMLDGKWGLYKKGGARVAIHETKRSATRHKHVLEKSARKLMLKKSHSKKRV